MTAVSDDSNTGKFMKTGGYHMKKFTAICLAAALVFSLAACGNSESTTSEESTPPSDAAEASEAESSSSEISEQPETDLEAGADGGETGSNILIAYFSWEDNTVVEDETGLIR